MPIFNILFGLSMVIVFAAAVEEEKPPSVKEITEKCWNKHMLIPCPNPAENIKCLKVGIRPNTKKAFQYHIKLSEFHLKNQIICPELAKEKTCYEEQYRNIIDGLGGIELVIGDKGYPKACPNITKTLQHLKDLKGWCGGKDHKKMNITKQIIRYEAVQKRCNDGFYQGFLLPSECRVRIYKCMNTMEDHYDDKEYREACRLINASIGCLDKIKSRCDYESMSEFDYAAKIKIKCDSGKLFDVCRTDIITRDCLTKYYRKKYQPDCEKSLVDATRQCLQKKNTECKTEIAHDHITWALERLDRECPK